jgi:uncharacterized protein YrrD
MLLSQARGRNVVDAASAETIGTVAGLVLAPGPARITALRLKSRGGADLLAWEDIQAFGPDAVIVAPAADRGGREEAQEGTGATPNWPGKMMLTESGQQLGLLMDIDFDAADGHIHRLIGTGTEVDGEKLLGIGTFAAIVANT